LVIALLYNVEAFVAEEIRKMLPADFKRIDTDRTAGDWKNVEIKGWIVCTVVGCTKRHRSYLLSNVEETDFFFSRSNIAQLS
jgi:hypothetical protein